MNEFKTCTRCKQIKPLNEFAKDSRLKSGRGSKCVICKREQSNIYRINNLDSSRSRVKNWQENNREQTRINAKQWTANNSERVRELSRLRYAKNPEKQREAETRWIEKNPNAKAIANQVRRSRENNGKRFLVTDKEIAKIKAAPCFACGSKDRVEIEHLIPVSRGGDYSIGNFASLCKSCNSSKRNKTVFEWKIYRRKIGKPILIDGYNRSGGF